MTRNTAMGYGGVSAKTEKESRGFEIPGSLFLAVVGTGVDPVTYRFSGGRSAN